MAEMKRLNVGCMGEESKNVCGMAHTLKGVAGTLGLLKLQKSADKLETRIRAVDGSGSDNTAKELLQTLYSELSKFHRGLMLVNRDPRGPPADSEPDPIDTAALTRVFGDDVTAQTNILRKFCTQSDEIVTDFESAYKRQDLKQISFLSHKLKSSARTVGANDLADLCFVLEKASKDSDWHGIDAVAEDLRPIVEGVKRYVDGR
jgi:HPt (histidine-containing phosphotransfer) domain-containing protein